MEGYPDPPELRGIIPKSFEVGIQTAPCDVLGTPSNDMVASKN